MKRSRFTEEQIIGILKEQEAGAKTADVCRKHGISLLPNVCMVMTQPCRSWPRERPIT
ncbi:Transposase [compost metagenome]